MAFVIPEKAAPVRSLVLLGGLLLAVCRRTLGGCCFYYSYSGYISCQPEKNILHGDQSRLFVVWQRTPFFPMLLLVIIIINNNNTEGNTKQTNTSERHRYANNYVVT